MERGQNMERHQVLSCLTECSLGRAISLFLFLLVSVLSLLISVMSLVLSWNSLTERSEGEVFHGFYVWIWKGVRIWKRARILKGVRSCHEIAWLNAARESNVMVSISFCLCPVRIWKGQSGQSQISIGKYSSWKVHFYPRKYKNYQISVHPNPNL